MSRPAGTAAKAALDASTDRALAAFRDKRRQGSPAVTAAESIGKGLAAAVSTQFPALGADAARLMSVAGAFVFGLSRDMEASKVPAEAIPAMIALVFGVIADDLTRQAGDPR